MGTWIQKRLHSLRKVVDARWLQPRLSKTLNSNIRSKNKHTRNIPLEIDHWLHGSGSIPQVFRAGRIAALRALRTIRILAHGRTVGRHRRQAGSTATRRHRPLKELFPAAARRRRRPGTRVTRLEIVTGTGTGTVVEMLRLLRRRRPWLRWFRCFVVVGCLRLLHHCWWSVRIWIQQKYGILRNVGHVVQMLLSAINAEESLGSATWSYNMMRFHSTTPFKISSANTHNQRSTNRPTWRCPFLADICWFDHVRFPDQRSDSPRPHRFRWQSSPAALCRNGVDHNRPSWCVSARC